MIFIRSILFLTLFIASRYAFSQSQGNTFRILFYNVENLFDPFDDTLTEDDEFTPGGARHWTYGRFLCKLNRLYKVLAVSGGWEPPDIIALAETEHRWIVEKLAGGTPFSKYEYKVVHKESPDRRGIDLSVLYREDSFILLKDSAIPVRLKEDPPEYTRDILHLKGITKYGDTLHFLFNHWPSRYQGQAHSEWKRIISARVLRQKVAEIMAAGQGNGLIAIGDFNDEPGDISLVKHLGAKVHWSDTVSSCLYNLSAVRAISSRGTHKFQGRWYVFDQAIVSGELLRSARSCTVHILDFDFLLEEDEAYLGVKPFRTYNGYTYLGGFSDHLPVLLEITLSHP